MTARSRLRPPLQSSKMMPGGCPLFSARSGTATPAIHSCYRDCIPGCWPIRSARIGARRYSDSIPQRNFRRSVPAPDHAASGLDAKGDGLTGFEIAGADRIMSAACPSAHCVVIAHTSRRICSLQLPVRTNSRLSGPDRATPQPCHPTKKGTESQARHPEPNRFVLDGK